MFDYVFLSRVQFALTAIFHILFPVLTIGLSLFLVVMEGIWLKTRQEVYYRQTRFWATLLLLTFAVGVATGIPMEFQFGTNWNRFSHAGGDVFGHLLGFEAAVSFMLEASFLGIMLFGWNRVSPKVHMLSTCMVCFGAFLSGFWIMAANSWMQTPAGGFVRNGIFEITSQWHSIFNPATIWGVSHMLVACLVISLFVMGAISAWYMLKGRHTDFYLKSFKLAVLAAILFTPLQIYLGDGSGREVFIHQPAKLAAMEAHWETNHHGEAAPFRIIAWPLPEEGRNQWEIEIPYLLSLIVTRSLHGTVMGMEEFAPEDRPPVWLTYIGFRLMVALGFGFFFLMLWTLWVWARGGLTADRIQERRSLLYSWILAAPLSYLAMEAGWVVREVGRQPWTLYGLLRTGDSASVLPGRAVGTTLVTFILFYLIIPVVFVIFARRHLEKGPHYEET